jgi:PAS domain S-box-containing protein
MAAIVESSDDAIISKDLNGIVTDWNKSAERIFGCKAAEIVGRPIATLIPTEFLNDENVILAKIRAGERVDHFQTVRVKKNGEPPLSARL